MLNKSELKAFIHRLEKDRTVRIKYKARREQRNNIAQKTLRGNNKARGCKRNGSNDRYTLHHQIAVFALASVKSVHPYSARAPSRV
jgi:hypothetical protein